MKTEHIKAPAKINFGLNILNKREDGYHNIETIFYPVNLYDNLSLTISDYSVFSCNVALINNSSSNLIGKAVEVLENHLERKFTLEIKLIKNIPIGAGMGGGSSDAAYTLLSLNRMFNLGLSIDELKTLGLQIGSDVPFFINPKSYIATSRGEILKEIDFKIPYPILIVNPNIHVSTSWAYRNSKPSEPKFLLSEIVKSKNLDFKNLKEKVKNDFEEAVFKTYPEIGNVKNDLYSLGALFALMTGSGSTLFGIFPDLKSARKAEKSFKGKYFTFIHSEEV